MLCAIGGLLIVLLSMLGIVFLIKEAASLLMREKAGRKILLITHIEDNAEQAELILRSAAAKADWYGEKYSSEIICVDEGLSEETRKICELVCNDYSCLKLKTVQEIQSLLV